MPESAVSVPARLITAARATYPDAARSIGREADVPLEIVVDTAGAVVEAQVVGDASADFRDAARATIRRYRFSAAQRDGHAVRVRMRWILHFRLQD
jgi:TonB family protein